MTCVSELMNNNYNYHILYSALNIDLITQQLFRPKGHQASVKSHSKSMSYFI